LCLCGCNQRSYCNEEHLIATFFSASASQSAVGVVVAGVVLVTGATAGAMVAPAGGIEGTVVLDDDDAPMETTCRIHRLKEEQQGL
jgi:hypothetical protein